MHIKLCVSAVIKNNMKYPFFTTDNSVFKWDGLCTTLDVVSKSWRDLLGGVGGAEGKAIYRIKSIYSYILYYKYQWN